MTKKNVSIKFSMLILSILMFISCYGKTKVLTIYTNPLTKSYTSLGKGKLLLARRNDFDKTIESLFYAIKKGFKVKINVVLIGGFNDDEIQDFVNLANKYDLEVRFIELMQIGETANWSKDKFVSNKIVLEKVPKFEFDGVSGVAKIYKIKGQKGKIGLISPISCSFCSDCNRIRLTSDGKLKSCLHSKDEINLKGLSGEELEEVFKRGIFDKPEKHHLEEGKSESARDMNKIGG